MKKYSEGSELESESIEMMLIRNIGHIFLEIVEKRVVSRKLSGFFFFLDFRCFNYCLSAWHENLPDAPLGRVPSCHL